MTDVKPDQKTVLYRWDVHPDVDTPIPPGAYVMRLVEGGRYRNVASSRVYSVREILGEDPPRIRYQYTRGREAEPVEREGNANELAVVQALDGTPTAIVANEDWREP